MNLLVFLFERQLFIGFIYSEFIVLWFTKKPWAF